MVRSTTAEGMAKDEREEEREFLSGLKARTGRDLGEWMAVIAAQGFTDKNEIIDWLREQSLPFARASWLERIHRNGGKPIYWDSPPRKPTDKLREPEQPSTSVVQPVGAATQAIGSCHRPGGPCATPCRYPVL